MKTRMMLTVSLALLSLPGAVWSMESSTTRPGDDRDMRVYHLQSAVADVVVGILENVIDEEEIIVDYDDRTNSVIVAGPPARMDMIGTVIAALDKATPLTQMMYRVYMLELPPEDPNLGSFTLVIEDSKEFLAEEIMLAIEDAHLHIGAIRQRRLSNGRAELTIQGGAPSNEFVTRITEDFPDAKIQELRWEDDSFTVTVPGAQATQLPGPLQEHIRRLLGQGTQTVGYWFGDFSLPSTVSAPIGPWQLSLTAQLEPGDQEVTFLIRVVREAPGGGRGTNILSNTVRSRIGKPIIIGYNRDRYGTRTMGALVILPEEDATSVRH